METVAEITRQQIHRAERKVYRQAAEDLQRLLRRGSALAVAEALDRHCPHCGALLIPEIVEVPNLDRLFPLFHSCDCDGAREAKQAAATQAEAIEQRLREKVHQDALANAGLNGWLREATFDTFSARADWSGAMACRTIVQRFVDCALMDRLGGCPWLVLYGPYGTGKTHLAVAALHEVIDAGWRNVFFRPWTQYLKRLQASWDRRGSDERGESTGEIVAELQRGRLVALDDLDKRESEWTREELYTALNYRYNHCLPTILTFNFGPGDPDPKAPGRLALERYLGRAILDRVIGAAFEVVRFAGPSYRSKVVLQAVTT